MGSSGSSHASATVWARIGQGVAVLLIAGYLIWTIPGVRPTPVSTCSTTECCKAPAMRSSPCCACSLRCDARHSIAWWLVTAGVVLRAIGFVVSLWFISIKHPLPYPSIADAAWVLSTIALIGAVAFRVRDLVRRMPIFVVLDGLTGSLVVVAIAIAVLSHAVRTLSAAGIPRSEIIVNVGYPVLDTALLVAVATLLTSVRGRITRSDLVLAAGCVAFSLIDIVYVIELANGSWRPGTLLASLSLVATALIATSVWSAANDERPRKRRLGEMIAWRPPGIGVPVAFAGVAFVGAGRGGPDRCASGVVGAFVAAGAVGDSARRVDPSRRSPRSKSHDRRGE